MQADFRGWYEAVSLECDQEHLEARWEGVESVAEDATRTTMEALIRLAFRSRQQVASAELAELRNDFAGEAGPPGDEELSLLASATLAQILTRNDADAAMAATLVKAAEFGGLRHLKQPMDLIGLAANAIVSLADSSRRRPSLALGNATATKIDPAAAIEKLQAIDPTTVAAALTALAGSVTSTMASLSRRQQQFEQAVQTYVRMQDEELDMLWWLQGGRSLSLNIPFTDIDAIQRPFVLSRELAQATFALPGPPAISALLLRAGIEDDAQIAIADAVQSLSLEWLQEAIPEDCSSRISPVTTPIHEAIRRRLEVHGEDTWIPAWTSVCALDRSSQLPALELAVLVYREQLLIHHG